MHFDTFKKYKRTPFIQLTYTLSLRPACTLINHLCACWLSRSDSLNLGEVFQAASKKDHQKLWNGVLEVVQPIVDEGRWLPAAEDAVINTYSSSTVAAATPVLSVFVPVLI